MINDPWKQLQELANNGDDVPIDLLRWAVAQIEGHHGMIARLKKVQEHKRIRGPRKVAAPAAEAEQETLEIPHFLRRHCDWREVAEADCTTWESACGQKWVFEADGPTENGVKFCQGCGKPILLVDVGQET